MISILPEHISFQFLFAQQKITVLPKEISSNGSPGRETGEEVLHRLREAIAEITSQEPNQITASTSFEELFPRNDRRQKMKKLKQATGYSIQLLRPKAFLYYLSAFLFLLSIIVLFINGSYGLLGIIGTIIVFYTGQLTGIEFVYPTVGQAAEKITIDQLIPPERSAF